MPTTGFRVAAFVVATSWLSFGTVSAQRAIPFTPVAAPAPQAPAGAPAGSPAQRPAAPTQPPTSAQPSGAPKQQPATSAQPEASTQPVTPTQPAAPVPPENYTYQPEGRRDPFLNLLGQGAEPRSGKRADGAAGLMVAEVAVKGIVESRGALLAMIQGPDNKTYIVRQGDRLVDGTVRSVTPQGLIIVQEVNDPLSLVKQREVYKLLRSPESAKE